MYLCSICGKCTRPGQPLLVHVVERLARETVTVYQGGRTTRVQRLVVPNRKEIDREIPVCPLCHRTLKGGAEYHDLVRLYERKRPAGLPPVAFAPPVPEKPLMLGTPANGLARPFRIDEALREVAPFPNCDLCGGPVGDGQATAQTCLCRPCVDKTRRAKSSRP